MFASAVHLRQASRVPALARADAAISPQELAALVACGALAAVAVALIHPSLQAPGSAILRAVFPMAAGLACVPRRSAGWVMAAGALATAIGLRLGHVGEMQPAALVSLLAFGPLVDGAVAQAPLGWRLYARFAAAGAAANLLAFVARYAVALWFRRGGTGTGLGRGLGRIAEGHDFLSFWPVALVSFLLCGALAGLVSAAVWFQWSPPPANHEPR